VVQKVKSFLVAHEREYELLRYLIAGGLTTALSIAVFSAVCIALAPDHTINGATEAQATAANVVSWIIAVLFAFWINRRMVFLRKGGETQIIFKELGQFVLGRLASGAIFEIGLFYLLATLGVTNDINKLVVLVLVTVFNYVVSKFWIFAKKPQPPPASEAAPAAEEDSPPAQEPVRE